MADIKLRTGEILYQFPTDVAHALICLGLAEKHIIPTPEKKPGSLRFAMDRTRSSGEPYVHYKCDACSQSGALLNSNPAGSPGRSARGLRKKAHGLSFFGIAEKKKCCPRH